MESLQISKNLGKADKKERYESLLPQIFALVEGETDLIANLANIAAALKEGLGFFWVGFYLVKTPLFSASKTPPGKTPPGKSQLSKSGVASPSHGELVLGPFQGPIACTRIGYGKGVCGQAWAQGKTLIVDDVEKFPGHIACNSASKSEIVVPFYLQPDFEGETRKIMGVLDVDSDRLAAFDQTDELYLSQLLARLIRN